LSKVCTERSSRWPAWRALFPHTLSWQNYLDVFARVPFVRYLFNSLFITLTIVLLGLVINALAGYAFADIVDPKDFQTIEKLLVIFWDYWRKPGTAPGASILDPGGHRGHGEQSLGDLDRVGRSPLAHVVGDHPQDEPVLARRIAPDATHVHEIGPGRPPRQRIDPGMRIIGDDDARRTRQAGARFLW